MKELLFLLAFIATLGTGCDDSSVHTFSPGGSGSFDVVGLLQTMTAAKVTVMANTLHHTFVQQGGRDPGNTTDFWGVREYIFESKEPGMVWSDSGVASELRFSVLNVDPPFAYDVSSADKSLMRCTIDASGKTIHDLLCTASNYDNPESGDPDFDNNRYRTLSFSTPTLILDSVFDDSVSFVIRDPAIWQHISLAYSHDETVYTTYKKQFTLTAFDTLGVGYPNTCRLVFFKK
ncbi:MAG TPA: hypothetical protein VFO76_08395 [Candidatus Kapabacteria bacterium]|nr:hypothetical protein [Candidatus Kapabacteria bacterium]